MNDIDKVISEIVQIAGELDSQHKQLSRYYGDKVNVFMEQFDYDNHMKNIDEQYMNGLSHLLQALKAFTYIGHELKQLKDGE